MDVTMPDGTVIRNVPEGTTKAQLLAKLDKFNARADKKTGFVDALGEGIEQGATFGLADELAALGAGIGGAINPQKTFAQSYDRRLQEKRSELEKSRKDRPITTMAGELTGAVVTGGAGAKLGGKALSRAIRSSPAGTAAAIGALSSGVYGFGSGEDGATERLKQGGISAAVGAGAGIAGSKLASSVGPLVSRAAKKIRGKPSPSTGKTVQEIVETAEEKSLAPKELTLGEQNRAIKKVESAIKKDFPDNWEQALEAWKSGDQSLAELYGPRMTSLAKGAAQYPSGQAQAIKYFDEKTLSSPEKFRAAIGKNVSSIENYFATADDLLAAGQAKAKPLYKEAFAANKDMQSKRLDKILSDPLAVDAIKATAADFRRQGKLVGSPDPELTALIKELDTLERKALGTGTASAGLKLETLDAVKKRIDQRVRDAKRAWESGSGNFEQYKGYEAIRSNLVDEIDKLDVTQKAGPNSLKPEGGLYSRARATAGEYLRVQDAMDQGKEFMKLDPELIQKSLIDMSDSEKTAFKIGVGKQLRDLIDKTNEGGNPFNRVFGNEIQRNRLRKILSPDEYQNLERALRAENRIFKQRNEVLGGSPTTSKAVAAGMIAADGAEALTALTTGGVKGMGLSIIKGHIVKAFDGINDKTAEEVSRIIYTTDPIKKAALLERVTKNPKLTANEKEIVKRAYFVYEQAARESAAGAAAISPVSSGIGDMSVGEE